MVEVVQELLLQVAVGVTAGAVTKALTALPTLAVALVQELQVAMVVPV